MTTSPFEGRAEWVPFHTQAVAAIASTFRIASADDLREGLIWYRDAATIALAIGRVAGYKGKRATSVGAGILAALSPAFNWNDSIPVAYEIAGSGTVGTDAFTSDANFVKALAIKDGAPALDVLVGNKVRAFYASIIAKGETDAVCVDRHAMAIIAGRKLTKREQGGIVNVGVYDAVALAYVDAAAALGLAPAVLQAITWVTWRRLTYRRHAGFVPAQLAPITKSATPAA
jgi:hypothetical protein